MGALANRWLARRIGLGKTILGSSLTQSLLRMLLPAAALLAVAGPLFLGIGQLVGDAAGTISEVNKVTVRQGLTPDALLGRVNSTMNLAGASLGPLGALAGGFVGEKLGVPAALLISAVGTLLANGWLISSPIQHIRTASDIRPLPPTGSQSAFPGGAGL